MKKIIIVTLSVLVLLSGLPVYADFGFPEEPLYEVVTDIYGSYYWRDGSDTDGESDGKLPGGQTFYVWGDRQIEGMLYGTTDASAAPWEEDTSSFVYIPADGVWNKSDSVKPETGAKTSETADVVSTEELNIRSGPGTGFVILKTVPKDTRMTYDYTFEADGTWMYVVTEGVQGWASGKYLAAAPEQPSESINSTGNSSTDTAAPDSAGGRDVAGINKKRVIGTVMICLGVALIVALAAFLLLNKRR